MISQIIHISDSETGTIGIFSSSIYLTIPLQAPHQDLWMISIIGFPVVAASATPASKLRQAILLLQPCSTSAAAKAMRESTANTMMLRIMVISGERLGCSVGSGRGWSTAVCVVHFRRRPTGATAIRFAACHKCMSFVQILRGRERKRTPRDNLRYATHLRNVPSLPLGAWSRHGHCGHDFSHLLDARDCCSLWGGCAGTLG